MLGWWIVVSEGQPDGVMIDKANTLASWEAGLSGLRWLNDLLDARFGVAYAHRKSTAARLFLATHSHHYLSFIP